MENQYIDNDIDNGIKIKKTLSLTMNNDIERKYLRAAEVDRVADMLEAGLHTNSETRPFLCKAAWRLSEARLWCNYEVAVKGKNPIGLFIYLCKRDGV